LGQAVTILVLVDLVVVLLEFAESTVSWTLAVSRDVHSEQDVAQAIAGVVMPDASRFRLVGAVALEPTSCLMALVTWTMTLAWVLALLVLRHLHLHPGLTLLLLLLSKSPQCACLRLDLQEVLELLLTVVLGLACSLTTVGLVLFRKRMMNKVMFAVLLASHSHGVQGTHV